MPMPEDQKEAKTEKSPEITAEQLGAVSESGPNSGNENGKQAGDISEESTETEEEEYGEDGEDDEESEDAIEKISQQQQPLIEKLTSPEAIVMIPLALLLDCISIMLIIVVLDDFGILDIAGICTIGAWTFFRSKGQEMKVTGSAKEKADKALAKVSSKVKQLETKFPKATKWAKRLKWMRPLLITTELIPYVGALPSWTICVFLTLIHGNE
jgi:hypothetical protein